MNRSSVWIRTLAAGSLSLCAAAAQATTIVDLDALTSTGVTLQLGAGPYAVAFIGTAQGGAYNGWNPWGNNVVSGCNANGGNCAQGWTEAFEINIAGTKTQYGTAQPFFASAQVALAACQAGPLLQSINGAPATPASLPISFTLLAPTPVNFAVYDTQFFDNFGGVSLSVTAVPEPTSLALMLAGGGAMLVWRRRQTK